MIDTRGGGCAGFTGSTCALHIEGTSSSRRRYRRGERSQRDRRPAPAEAEHGHLLARNRATASPSPTLAAPCPSNTRGRRRARRDVRSHGGRNAAPDHASCRGPATCGRWSRMVTIAVEQGGSIEFMDLAGSRRGLTTEPTHQSQQLARLVSGRLQDRLRGRRHRGLRRVCDERGRHRRRADDRPARRRVHDCVVARRGSGGVRLRRRGGDGLADRDLASIEPDGSGRTESVARTEQRVESPTWSPGRERIAFTTSSGEAAAVRDGRRRRATSSESWSSPVSRSRGPPRWIDVPWSARPTIRPSPSSRTARPSARSSPDLPLGRRQAGHGLVARWTLDRALVALRGRGYPVPHAR